MSAWWSASLQWNKEIILRNGIVTQVEFYLHGVGESTEVYTQGDGFLELDQRERSFEFPVR